MSARISTAAQRIVILAALVGLLLTLVPAPAQAVDSRTPARIRNIIERKVNNARENNGLEPLTINKKMRRHAKDHSAYMASLGRLEHDSLTRIRIEVITGAIGWGENVGRTTADNGAAQMHRLFMNSPLHRANILDPRYTHLGVGVVKSGGYIYVTQRFAQR